MSGTRIHKQARTTPQLREEIRQSSLSERALAGKYNVTRSTVRKWKYRDTASDLSHRPHRLHTALSPAQEAIVVELRRSLLLSTDDLLVVVRKFIEPAFNRSTLQRLLVRHGVSNLKALVAEPEGEAKPKTFKHYQPAYVHIDIKYLPSMADEDERTYLFVAIDRASRWVYLERHRQKSQKAASRFLSRLREKASFHLRTTHFDAGADLDSMLWHYNRLYNHHIPQRALGHQTPVQKLKHWYAQHPELFRKQVFDQPGLDT